jgi:hypothetical protein
MKDFGKQCELEALKVQALGLLIESVVRMIIYGTTAPFGAAEANLLANSIRALAEDTPTPVKAYGASDISRRCDTCAHSDLDVDEGPCIGCFGEPDHPNWTDRGAAPDAEPCSCEEDKLKSERDTARAECEKWRVLAASADKAAAEYWNDAVERLKRELADTRERLEASEHDAVMARAAERTARAEANQLLESRALWMARCERAEKAWDAAMSERDKRIAELEYRLRACGIEP